MLAGILKMFGLLNQILTMATLILALPFGYLLAWLAKDELKQAQPYLYIMIIASVLSALWFYLTNRTDISLTFLFILITALVSVKKLDKRVS